MTKKQIMFTVGQGAATNTSYVMQLEEKGFTEKIQKLKKGDSDSDVPLEDFGLYKLTNQNTSVVPVPVPDEEIANLFGTTDGNKILDFVYKHSDIGSKVPV